MSAGLGVYFPSYKIPSELRSNPPAAAQAQLSASRSPTNRVPACPDPEHRRDRETTAEETSTTGSEAQNALSEKRNSGEKKREEKQQSALDYAGINLEAIKLNVTPI